MESDDRTIATVNADLDASLTHDVMQSDPKFASLCLNSIAASRVPDEAITVEDLEEGEWTGEEVFMDKAYQNIQKSTISKLATSSLLETNQYKAHLDGGLQVSMMNDKSLLWGFTWFLGNNLCKICLICAGGKKPIIPEGHMMVRVPTDNKAGCVPVKCCYMLDISKLHTLAKIFQTTVLKKLPQMHFELQQRQEDVSVPIETQETR